MNFIIDGDLIVGSIEGDFEGVLCDPEFIGLDINRLRYDKDDKILIDVKDRRSFYIDKMGLKHIISEDEYQILNCNFDDILVFKNEKWSVQTVSDRLSPLIKAECSARIYSIIDDNTQKNLLAYQNQILFKKPAGYEKIMNKMIAISDWIDAMRAACTSLIEAEDFEYGFNEKWPIFPSGSQQLIDQF